MDAAADIAADKVADMVFDIVGLSKVAADIDQDDNSAAVESADLDDNKLLAHLDSASSGCLGYLVLHCCNDHKDTGQIHNNTGQIRVDMQQL